MDPQLKQIVDRLNSLGSLAEDAAKVVARVIRAELKKTVVAGTTPEGVPWAPRKEDGARPMVDAWKQVKVKALGDMVYVALRGPEVRHQLGRIRGKVKVKRPVIMTGALPDSWVVKITKGIDRLVKKRLDASG